MAELVVSSLSVTCKSRPLELLTNIWQWQKSRFSWRRERVKLKVKINIERIIENVDNKLATRRVTTNLSECDVLEEKRQTLVCNNVQSCQKCQKTIMVHQRALLAPNGGCQGQENVLHSKNNPRSLPSKYAGDVRKLVLKMDSYRSNKSSGLVNEEARSGSRTRIA